jgi:hypothetical protein
MVREEKETAAGETFPADGSDPIKEPNERETKKTKRALAGRNRRH